VRRWQSGSNKTLKAPLAKITALAKEAEFDLGDAPGLGGKVITQCLLVAKPGTTDHEADEANAVDTNARFVDGSAAFHVLARNALDRLCAWAPSVSARPTALGLSTGTVGAT